jgi:hypothetical protein
VSFTALGMRAYENNQFRSVATATPKEAILFRVAEAAHGGTSDIDDLATTTTTVLGAQTFSLLAISSIGRHRGPPVLFRFPRSRGRCQGPPTALRSQSLSVLRTPVKVDPLVFSSCCSRFDPSVRAVARSRGQGGAPAAKRGRTTLRPTRIHRMLGRSRDEAKTLWFKSCAASGEGS